MPVSWLNGAVCSLAFGPSVTTLQEFKWTDGLCRFGYLRQTIFGLNRLAQMKRPGKLLISPPSPLGLYKFTQYCKESKDRGHFRWSICFLFPMPFRINIMVLFFSFFFSQMFFLVAPVCTDSRVISSPFRPPIETSGSYKFLPHPTTVLTQVSRRWRILSRMEAYPFAVRDNPEPKRVSICLNVIVVNNLISKKQRKRLNKSKVVPQCLKRWAKEAFGHHSRKARTHAKEPRS